MSIWIIALLGASLIIAVLYCIMGGGTIGIWITLVFIVMAVIFAINNDKTPVGYKRSFLDRLKPYDCQWCRKRFWTLKGNIKHNQKFHPERIKMYRTSQHRQGSSIDYRNYKQHDCNWCHGSGKVNGVTCDWCGGSGKLP